MVLVFLVELPLMEYSPDFMVSVLPCLPDLQFVLELDVLLVLTMLTVSN
jgi:hypothetical protein